MAFEKIGVEAVIDGMALFRSNADEFNRHIAGMSSAASGGAGGTGILSGALGTLAGAAGNVLQIVGGIIGAQVFSRLAGEIASIAGEALRAASNFQMLQIQMEGLLAIQIQAASGAEDMAAALASAKQPAAELIDWITDMAVKSNITVEQFTEMTRGLLALGMGVEPTKQMLTAFGNLAAGLGLTGDQLNRVEWNLTQTSRAMKITERDLREYGNAGIPVNAVLDEMAQQMGVTREAAAEFAKSGEEGVAAFNAALIGFAEKNFPDAMDRLSKTWVVAMSNIQDFIQSVLGKEVLGPALAHFGELVGGILDRLLAMRLQFREWGEQLGAIVAALITRIQPIIDILFSPESWQEKLGATLNVMQGWAAEIGTWIANQLPVWQAQLTEWGRAFVDWIVPQIPGLLTRLGEFLMSGLTWIESRRVTIVEKLASWGTAFLQWVVDASPALLAELNDLLPRVLEWIHTSADTLRQLWIEKWGPALTRWAEENGPEILMTLGLWLGTITRWLLTVGLQLLIETIVGLGQAVLSVIRGDLFNPQTGNKLALDFIKGLLGGLLGAEDWWDVEFMITTWTIKIKEIINNAWVMLGIYTVTAWSIITNAIKKYAEDIRWAIFDKWQDIYLGTQLLWERFVRFLKTTWEGLKSGIVDWATGLWDKVREVWNIISDIISDPMKREEFVRAGMNWIGGIISGLWSRAGELWQAISQIVQQAIQSARNALGIFSPSKVAAEKIGLPIIQGITQEILASVGDVRRAMGAVVSAGMSPALPVAAPAGAFTNNTNFTLNMTSMLPPHSVVQDFNILRSLASV